MRGRSTVHACSDRRSSLAKAWRGAQRRQIVGPRHARPWRACAWLRSRRFAADLTPLARRAQEMAGRDGGTGALIEQRNFCQQAPLALAIVRPIRSRHQCGNEHSTPRTRKFGHYREASNGARSGSNRVDLIRVDPRHRLFLSAVKFLPRVNRCRFARERNLPRIRTGDDADWRRCSRTMFRSGEYRWTTVLPWFPIE
jgi:hypothetical protein